MSSVMLSIRPEWCEKILAGKKTIEVRKTRPKLETPFKCYIYCAKNLKRVFVGEYSSLEEAKTAYACGKVIGEFMCDKIRMLQKRGIDNNFDYCYLSLKGWGNDDIAIEITDIKRSCIGKNDLNKYGEKSHCLYTWHISDLKIYDKPKELSEFNRYSEDYDRPCEKGEVCEHEYFDYSEDCKACRVDFDGENCPKMKLHRPPQSWCYVEEETK